MMTDRVLWRTFTDGADERTRFLECLKFVLKWEGDEFTDDPDDPGGATRFGITQSRFDQHQQQRAERRGVIDISREEIETIYFVDHWRTARVNALFAPRDIVIFDTAVNCGPSAAVKWLQRAAGVVVDGIVGDRTVEAANTLDRRDLIFAVVQQRRAHCRTIARRPPLGKFLRGWLNRVDALWCDACRELAEESTP